MPRSTGFDRACAGGVDPSSRSLACLVGFLAPTLWCSSWVPWLRAVPILVIYLVVVVLIRYVASLRSTPDNA